MELSGWLRLLVGLVGYHLWLLLGLSRLADGAVTREYEPSAEQKTAPSDLSCVLLTEAHP